MVLPIKARASFIFLFLYVVIRFLGYTYLESLYIYASYVFEGLFVMTSLFIFRPPKIWFYKVTPKAFVTALLFLPLGYLTAKGAHMQRIMVPFDWRSVDLMVFLLIVAPVLEELLFRFTLWESLKEALKLKGYWLLLVTSLVFSFSHFHAYYFVPHEYHPFIFYQTYYTFLLGLACGYLRQKEQSIITPILLHGFFNLGFFANGVM